MMFSTTCFTELVTTISLPKLGTVFRTNVQRPMRRESLQKKRIHL